MRLISNLRAIVAAAEAASSGNPRPTRLVAAFRQISAELAAPCTTHDAGGACDRCPARYETDGRGFPHRSVIPKGCAPLRHCLGCCRAVPPSQWRASGVCAPCAQRIADELDGM